MKIKVFKLKEIKDICGTTITLDGQYHKSILPTYAKQGDACMDIYPIYYEYDFKTDNHIYHTGLAFAIGNSTNEICIDGIEHTLDYNIPNEMELRPRSSLTKTSFYMPNSPGTLDWGYRGELLVKFKNRTSTDVLIVLKELYDIVNHINEVLTLEYGLTLDNLYGLKTCKTIINSLKTSVSTPPYECNGKDRCCQLLVRGVDRIEWEEVDSIEKLGTTDRGDGGFGHTDKLK